MADLNLAEELRAAAARLRKTAACAHGGPWAVGEDGATIWSADIRPYGAPCVAIRLDCGDATWIAMMHPGLAERLANLLDDLADEAEATYATEVHLGPDATYATGVVDYRGELCSDLTHALATARTILGAAEQPGGEPAPAEQPVKAADLRPDMVVSHPTWLNGDPVRVVTARVGAGVVAIRYRDVRAHHPDTQVKVPPDFQVTPGAGFVDGAR